jgi:tripartite ATP-independent transporter DctM subunit
MTTVLGTLLGVLFGTLASGLWVGITLLFTSLVLLMIFRDIPVDRLVPEYVFNTMTKPELVALPLFIAMGELLFRTRLSRSLFNGLAPWAALLPGRLLHVNVVGCSIFAAISGSSAVTTQVVGRISLTELRRRGYSENVAIGSLAGAGTLGFLIPPSTIMIIYGVLADESVLRLFTAGFIPGFILAGCFMLWVMFHTTVQPDLVPESERMLKKMPLRERFAALRELAPAVFLILCVLGSMYGGIATPSEAAALGVVGALIVSKVQGALSMETLREVALGSVQTCGMIGLIVLGASTLGHTAAFLGVPSMVAEFVGSLGLSTFQLILVLVLFYIVLGCFLDGFSIIVMTLPVVLPLVNAVGFDKLWFGIFLVVVVEMSQITPPVGFNLFVIQGLTGKPLGEIAIMTLPYLLVMVIFTGLLALYPGMVSFLPDLLLK